MRWPVGMGGAALLGLVGCSPQGYADFGTPVDRSVSLASDSHSTWMGPADQGVQWLTLAPIAEGRGELTWGRHVGAVVTVDVGNYEVVGDTLEVHTTLRFTMPDEEGLSTLQKQGSSAEELDVYTTLPYATEEGAVTLDGEPLWPLPTVVERLLASEERSVVYSFFRLFPATVQTRIQGFGGAGMIQYFGKSTPFAGRIGGQMVLSAENPLGPRTEFCYQDFSDVSGVSLEGCQSQRVDTSGAGYLFGELAVSIVDEAGAEVFSMAVDYGEADGDPAIAIDGKVMLSGTYGIVLQGESLTLPHDAGHIDEIIAFFAEQRDAAP